MATSVNTSVNTSTGFSNRYTTDATKFIGCSSRKRISVSRSVFSCSISRCLLNGLFISVCIAYALFLILPLISIFEFSGIKSLYSIFNKPEVSTTIILSLKTSFITIILTFFIGTPISFYLSDSTSKRSYLRKLVEIITKIPVLFPPSIAGLGLILAFGRNGLVGKYLYLIGIEFSFTITSVIIVQFFISSAFYIQIFKTALSSIDTEIYEAAYICGAGRITTMLYIVFPMTLKHIVTGLSLSWVRALGEFGATIVFAGNVLGKTRTLPLQIYTFMQNDMKSAAALSVLLYIISFVLLGVTQYIFKREGGI